MHEQAIMEIDQAALGLVQMLDTYGVELKPYLEEQTLAHLRAEVINLRRVLLGLEMGILYQDWRVPEEILAEVAGRPLPVADAASHVAERIKQG
ncbi:MAG: hypothetical protein MUD01_27490 [Chloroflexaceae bacterium]|jgi:hypothetical protein|nr:hypothetical protein [Chloroflexaceae bacterium]